MTEAEIISRVLGDGSLSIGAVLLIMGWLASRRIAAEAAIIVALAREGIDAYTERTRVMSSIEPRPVKMVGTVRVAHAAPSSSGDHKTATPGQRETWPRFNER